MIGLNERNVWANAKSRVGFAEGAVRAAEWIKGKTGFYEFPEIVDQL